MILAQSSQKEDKAQPFSMLLASSAMRRHPATITFLLLIIVATTTAGSSCSKLKNESSRNEATLNAPLDFCELVRRPDNYDSKTVRVRSVLTGFHELALYSTGCDGQVKYIRADFDSKVRNELVQRVTNLGGAGMQRGNFWVDVVLIGRFQKIPQSDCKKLISESGMPNRYYPNYCYRIVIENVETVEPVPATVAWPQ